IEEILNKIDGAPQGGRPPIRMRRSWRSRISRTFTGLRGRLPSVSGVTAGNAMLLGIGLMLASLFVRSASTEVARWAIIVGLVLFVGSFIFMLFRRDRSVTGSGDAYWRGQRIPRSTLREPSAIDRLRAWWRRRNRRGW